MTRYLWSFSIIVRVVDPKPVAVKWKEVALNRLRVVLADDHAAFLERVVTLLEPHFDVIGTVANGAELLVEAQRLRPDVVVLDISMPKLNGIAAATQLCASESTAKLVFLTIEDSSRLVHACLATGALGFVTKNRLTIDLPTAIHETVAGRRFISPMGQDHEE